MSILRYPKECCACTEKQTFYITNELTPALSSKCKGGANDKAPLMIYDSFARFDFCIINTEKKAASATIPVSDMVNIIEQSKILYHENVLYKLKQSSSTSSGDNHASAAHTVKISMGALKGKTPAQVLLENAANKAMLENQILFLEKQTNSAYAEANKRQITAIREALTLFESGKLTAETQGGSVMPVYMIYESPVKVNCYESGKRSDGKHMCRKVKITYQIGEARPVVVNIENFYANMTTNEKGLHQYVPDTIDSKINNTVRLTAEWWNSNMYICQSNMRMFENIYASTQYKDACNCAADNRREAKEKMAV
ncbi:MAG: hypothetical protein K5744_02050 [Eubacterium sp.]|jgi:hypothetical protein|nr:hypothetical protein [Eubacterium sp.]